MLNVSGHNIGLGKNTSVAIIKLECTTLVILKNVENCGGGCMFANQPRLLIARIVLSPFSFRALPCPHGTRGERKKQSKETNQDSIEDIA